MVAYRGPLFTMVDSLDIDELERTGGFRARQRPLLVKRAVTRWPAWQSWSFAFLSGLTNRHGRSVETQFQNGLTEQGPTRAPLRQAIAPYLRDLQDSHSNVSGEGGLYPEDRAMSSATSEPFHLCWDYMQTFAANRVYLALWSLFREFPALRKHVAIRDLWPGWRWSWAYAFIGPAKTVTGLHYDHPSNWFCQIRGVKEVMLFPPENTPFMCPSSKFDSGGYLSDIDISRLPQQARERTQFEKAAGIYARVEAGDALFIPKRTWHAVVSRTSAISLAVFGMTIPEMVVGGGATLARDGLHRLGLYRHGNCTCHEMPDAVVEGSREKRISTF